MSLSPLPLLNPGQVFMNTGSRTAVGTPTDFTPQVSSSFAAAASGAGYPGVSASGLVATGSTAANGTLLTALNSEFATVATGTCCVLNTSLSGTVTVFNQGTNALSVLPPGVGVSGQIDALGANTAFVFNSGGVARFTPFNGGKQWFSG